MNTQTSKPNQLYRTTYNKIANSHSFKREDLINSFNQDSITRCWEVFCGYISKNYQIGKGTIVPSFGTFTFTDFEVNLEGTTNQFVRDKKQRKPVFIVSNEFVETLKPGIVTDKSVIKYTQKLNNSISHVKVNYSELSISANLNKTDFVTIINHLLKFIGENIRNNIFKNKELPGLGAIVLKNNILAVRFNNQFTEKVKSQPQKLFEAKKNVKLYMNVNTDEGVNRPPTLENEAHNHLAKSLSCIRPKTTIITKVTETGEKWLKENLDIDINEINETDNENKTFESTRFFNDANPKKSVKKMKLSDIGLDTKVLEDIYLNKAIILSELKGKDVLIKKELSVKDVTDLLYKLSSNHELSYNKVKELVQVYSDNSNKIDYFDFMESLINDIKVIIHIPVEKTSRLTKSQGTNLRPFSATSTRLNNSFSEGKIKKVELSEVQKELRTIKSVIQRVKEKYSTKIEQKISFSEFANILKEFDVVYPSEKNMKILLFLELNPNSFSLENFISNLDMCKIIHNELTSEDLIRGRLRIKDIVFTSKKSAEEIFSNTSELSKEDFIKFIKAAANDLFLTDLIVESIFFQITKMDRKMTLEEFKSAFYKSPSESFEVEALRNINERIAQKSFNSNEYFDHLVSHKTHRVEGAQEIDYLFDILDTKKDGFIDREEWNSKIKSISDPLFKIQDLIKRNNLEIDDILFRMQIDPNKNEPLNFIQFKTKMKLLDNQLDHNFINSLFLKMKNSKDTVETKMIHQHFNVFKKESFRDLNSDSFKLNFIDHIKRSTNHQEIRYSFEKMDGVNSGVLDKVSFCNVVQKYSSEYKDEDIMRFIRISSLFDKNRNVKYPEFIDLIFLDNQDSSFNKVISVLKNHLQSSNNNLSSLIKTISKKSSSGSVEVNEMLEFLRMHIKDVSKYNVIKLDLDQDGKISLDDLKGILDRHKNTFYFKYENSDDKQEVNLHPLDSLDPERYKQIVKDIKVSMSNKNLTLIGLFRKLDSNNDGFISSPEFNKNIDSLIQIAPAIKDQFFNSLDARKLGLVDLETFLAVFKEFSSNEKIYENSWNVEDHIINEFKKWVLNHPTLSENELFSAIDFDFDGNITPKDFRIFLTQKLNFIKNDFNDYQIERTLQIISPSRNKFLGLNDMKHIVSKIRKKEGNKIVSKNTFSVKNMPHEKVCQWVDGALEKLGLYISDNFIDLQSFFKKFASEEDKMRFEDFYKFVKSNMKCFEGLNLTKDEYLTLFSSIDPHKKSYLKQADLKNKLEIYNFSDKIHKEIKEFIKASFKSNVDGFKYFMDSGKSDNVNKLTKSHTTHIKFTLIEKGIPLRQALNYERENKKDYLTQKEMFNGLNRLFPGKYSTNQILMYINSKFKNPEKIEFNEFSYLFYDTIQRNSTAPNDSFKERTQRALSTKVRLCTPFDHDPMEKLRRILKSSKFDCTEIMEFCNNSTEGLLNENELRNILKKINMGLTNLEIDVIIKRVGKTLDGKINVKEFMKLSSAVDDNLNQISVNLKNTLSTIKQLIYKYYSNPKICFQFNDKLNKQQIDFDSFKNLVSNMYKNETKTPPNYVLLKSIFDYIDIRKDGLIDLNEWLKTFNYTESSLEKKTLNDTEAKDLRIWETSKEMSNLYQLINKNRKQIRENLKQFTFKNWVSSEYFVNVLKEMFQQQVNLSNSQWSILMSLGDKDRSGQVNLDTFLNLVTNSAKINLSHPKQN